MTSDPTIDRRAFFAVLGLAALAAPRTAVAQQAGRVYRLGILAPTVPFSLGLAGRIPVALRELGYVEGQNLIVENRYAEGKLDRLPGLARELVQLRMDVIVAVAASATRAERDATTTIPIIQLALKHRLPAIYEWPDQVEDGGLMAYGTSRSELERRMAAYIDRIFKGAKPGDLPVEQPTTFELVINLRTTRALRLTLPQSLLRRADRVIE